MKSHARVVLVLQARTGSSRLPGKALQPLAGQPLLGHVLDRAGRVGGVHQLVVATSVAERDRPLVALAHERGWASYCGSERDVLERVRGAAATHRADLVVRVTGDCPLFCPDVAEYALWAFRTQPLETHYLSNDTSTSGWPDGTDVEVFTMEALDRAANEARSDHDREHVTPWMRRSYAWGALRCDRGDFSSLKLSVDSPEDLERVRLVYAAMDSFGDRSFDALLRAARRAGLLGEEEA